MKPMDLSTQFPEPQTAACPDCRKTVSRQSESCPHCGRFFQNLRPTYISRSGWIGTIAIGIIMGYFGILLVNAFLFFIALMFFAGALSSAADKFPK